MRTSDVTARVLRLGVETPTGAVAARNVALLARIAP
jgi:hypothetical protein